MNEKNPYSAVDGYFAVRVCAAADSRYDESSGNSLVWCRLYVAGASQYASGGESDRYGGRNSGENAA